MISASFDFTGLNVALDRITAAANGAARKAAQAGAQVYHDEVRARVPMSAKPHKSGKRTYSPGNLRAAIYQAYADRESTDSVAVYRISWNKKEAFYGKFLEFGTSKMAAKPFLRPAYDAARPRSLSAVMAVMHAEVRKALS